MPIVTKSDILAALKTVAGENMGDDVITMMENIEDTFNDYESKLSEDWKTKFETNDAEWRRKYQERFFGAGITTPEAAIAAQEENVTEDGEPRSYEELFTEREG